MKIVRVRWIDACMSGGWNDLPEAMTIEAVAIESVGFLLTENKRWIKLAQSFHPSEAGNTLEIPKAWILKIKRIGSVHGR